MNGHMYRVGSDPDGYRWFVAAISDVSVADLKIAEMCPDEDFNSKPLPEGLPRFMGVPDGEVLPWVVG